MKNKSWLILLIYGLLISCSFNSNKTRSNLKFGKYYIGNRLINDIIILKKDSTYTHIAKNDKGVFYKKTATWSYHDDKLTLENYVVVFDDASLELMDTLSKGGSIEFTIRDNYLSIENEHLNYYHQSIR